MQCNILTILYLGHAGQSPVISELPNCAVLCVTGVGLGHACPPRAMALGQGTMRFIFKECLGLFQHFLYWTVISVDWHILSIEKFIIRRNILSVLMVKEDS